MTTIIHINCPKYYLHRVDTARARAVATTTLIAESPDQGFSVTIAFVGNNRIKALNREFLETNQITDVLAFLAMETDPSSGEVYLGDIIISVPRAEAQATEHRINVDDEISILIVHGMLHLLGYDHRDPQEKNRMWAVQNVLLNKFNLPIIDSEQD